jgi:hypothetical protein
LTAADLPGRLVDIVYAAAEAAGVPLWSIQVDLAHPREVLFSTAPAKDVATAQAVFARLGVTAAVSEPYGGQPQVSVEALVPALGGIRVLAIATSGWATTEAMDPTDLVAEVDAAREAAEGEPPGAVRPYAVSNPEAEPVAATIAATTTAETVPVEPGKPQPTLAGKVASALSGDVCGADIKVDGFTWGCHSTWCPVDGSSDEIEAEFTTPDGDATVVLRVLSVAVEGALQ